MRPVEAERQTTEGLEIDAGAELRRLVAGTERDRGIHEARAPEAATRMRGIGI